MKKFIFCFDGTGNEPGDVENLCADGGITNIAKLHILFGGRFGKNNHEEETLEQKNFYYSGVGTQGVWFKRLICGILGLGMKRILKKAIKDLERNVDNNTEIYVFGFSRGAALARQFASKIKQQVKLLGVFDTVASIGMPDMLRQTFPSVDELFENVSVAKNVEKAVHLLALDEKRVTFQPTLFNHKDNVTEIWFSGAHSDVGGGFWFDSLSDITLEFMCKQAEDADLKVLKLSEIRFPVKIPKSQGSEIVKDDLEISTNAKGQSHEKIRPSGWFSRKLSPRAARVVRVNVNNKHSSDHIPIIHHTVCSRFKEVVNYRPVALRNTAFKIMSKDGNIDNTTFQGISKLREYVKTLED